MNIELSMHGPNSEAEIRSLYRWLRRQRRELRTEGVSVDLGGSADPSPDTMGTAFEVVQFVFDNVAQYGALAVAIASWRRAHNARCTISLERDGVKLTLTDAEIGDTDGLLRAFRDLTEAIDGPTQDSAAASGPDGDADTHGDSDIPEGEQ